MDISNVNDFLYSERTAELMFYVTGALPKHWSRWEKLCALRELIDQIDETRTYLMERRFA